MRVIDLDSEPAEGGYRVSARLEWEESARAPQYLYFESPALAPEILLERPEAFAVAVLPLAVLGKERRLLVDGLLCPNLRHGAVVVADVLQDACPGPRPFLVEATRGFVPQAPTPGKHAALLLSGGVDSLSLLRENRLRFQEGHPGSFRSGVFTFGLNTFDFIDGCPVPERKDAVGAYRAGLAGFARSVGLDLIPVETNVRALFPDYLTMRSVGAVAAIASTGIAVAEEFASLWASFDAIAYGDSLRRSQLLSLPWLSTSALEVRVGQAMMPRLDKLRLLAEWGPARAVLRTCLWLEIPEKGEINCGRCEKCLRTMLGLFALGCLDQFPTFPHSDLPVTEIAALMTAVKPRQALYYQSFPGLLRDRGREDLARAVEQTLRGLSGSEEKAGGPQKNLIPKRVLDCLSRVPAAALDRIRGRRLTDDPVGPTDKTEP